MNDQDFYTLFKIKPDNILQKALEYFGDDIEKSISFSSDFDVDAIRVVPKDIFNDCDFIISTSQGI